MFDVSPKNAPWLNGPKSFAKAYLLSQNYTTWKAKVGVALFIYAQVIEDFRWLSMQNVFTSYETGVSSTYPTGEQDVVEFFWSKYSLEVGVNLLALLTKWGIRLSANCRAKVAGFAAYVEKVNLFA